MKRKKLRQQRPEAFWGALIGAGASILGSFLGGRSQANAAQAQADAILQASKENAKALEEQNKNNNLLQQQSQEFIAEQNAETRQLQRDLQTSMQLQQGQLSTEERRRNNRIAVKRGGRVTSRKKLRDAFFYGGGNLPFRVTDGGGVLPLGQTPEGYDLYEIIGNDHDHYHKTRSGKYKSGVGIEFAGASPDIRDIQAKGGPSSKVVEGEGNQNGKQGEYLLVTPDNGLFISKHSINGFNPVEAVNAGMHPIDAYNIQEASKGSSPVRRNRHKATAGILVNDILPLSYPIYDVNNMVRRQLRKGGRCKAADGLRIGTFKPWQFTADNLRKNWGYFPGTTISNTPNFDFGNTPTMIGPLSWEQFQLAHSNFDIPALQYGKYTSGSEYNNQSMDNIRPARTNTPSRWGGLSGNLIGAGITGVGNLLGAGISNYFINKGAKIGSNAALEAGRIAADAVRNLQTVDMSMLDGESGRLMFSRGHYMPVTASTRDYNNYEREDIRRSGVRAEDAATRGSLSSASRMSRIAGIRSAGQEMLARAYDASANREAENRRANMAEINKAGASNLQLDIEALRDRTAARLDLLKYNNDIVNRKITEPAQLEADALTNSAGILSAAKNAIGQGWASAGAGFLQGVGNAIAKDEEQRMNLNMARMSATHSGNLAYLKYSGTPGEWQAEVTRLQNILNNPDSTIDMKDSARRDLRYLGIYA